ncbi:aldehyde dehydrogenase domain-containing protein [Aspergillus keveii]|uniref:Succinate-semialdehyde dehydrogenase, mitochondrial n=1 Tax=Aspergillus keveii TaxID=714993 RepID=A0ABR4FP19_9EURO
MHLQDPSLLEGVTLLPTEATLSAGTFEVINPATSTPIARLGDQTAADCEAAIPKALDALQTLTSLSARARSSLLTKWHTLVLNHKTDLATIITAENGKPTAEALAEVSYAAEFLYWFAGEAQRINGNVIPSSSSACLEGERTRVVTLSQPVGIVGLITPWNFPAAMITRKISAALAAGCPCILKPATETPLTAIALSNLATRAGIPPGAFQILATSAHTVAIGEILTTNRAIRKFSFTGSTPVGKVLAARCMGTMKRVSMELGGNAPVIVFDDADLQKAVDGIMAAKFRLAGQTCVCANRVFVQEGIYDVLVPALVERVRRDLRLGNGADEGTTMGPLVSASAADKVLRHVEDAVARGGKVLTGGRVASELGEAFFEPTVVVEVHPDSLCMREETFGPLLPIVRFETEEEAVALANAVPVGLAGYIFTENIARCSRVSEALEVGMVGVNTGKISDPAVPFGGIKESGLGREGSSLGIHEYLEVKSITINTAP